MVQFGEQFFGIYNNLSSGDLPKVLEPSPKFKTKFSSIYIATN
jgi:hypothetical protein